MAVRRRTWGAALATAALAATAVAVAGQAAAGASPSPHFTPRVINFHPTTHLKPASSTSLAGGLQTFTANQTDGKKTFQFTMVGKNPRVKQSSPTTTVKTEIIPLKIVLADGVTTSDPTLGNGCDKTPALTRLMKSPLVQKMSWSFGGTSVGSSAQYVDAFQRAEFRKFTKPSGVNPGYHVNLAYTPEPEVTVNVPAAAGQQLADSCSPLIGLKVGWLDPYLQNTLLPQLTTSGEIGTKTFPLFLVGNTVEYQKTPDNCCILGYHNAYSVSSGVQTYGIADYDNSHEFTGLANVEIASHEIAEWMNDPLGSNLTKPWGHVGQVTGCQDNLEVGDPLTGKVITRKVGTFTYDLQQLAFASWFYHQKPSIGVNGWYSNNGTFKTPAKICS